MIGSLSTLKIHLKENNIHDFNSLKEVLTFKTSYLTIRNQLIATHEQLIEDEKNSLDVDLNRLGTTIKIETKQAKERLMMEIDDLKQQLEESISNKWTSRIIGLRRKIINWNNNRRLRNKEKNFNEEVIKSIRHLLEIQQIKRNRFNYIIAQFSKAVLESAQTALSEVDRKKSVIEESSNYIYGAIGEQKVVKTLEALSDDYYLINDFKLSFEPAIYNKRDQHYIKSIQVDHLLVAPSGIFLIETKNWSEKSLQNLDLRSPVEQIRRSSYILFKMLNNELSNFNLNLDNHHWGTKKLPIKNLIVLINTKPKEEFQYVKVLTLKELLSYVNYFKPIFSPGETKQIADFLLAT
ncbi:nuclease-related domain-containing protein [Pedobacter sandarakinus]|uniref:nuclease-related domain-containing protein n=1 Tax=Pedobacter sandarakinus TaxID=353156 RepID=UPI002246CF4C|nr:nuclease-related domain-containing protein [Pedobacter sandarakinus]MCX2574980.1 nuclease-related domain-containing protein [Pedobacter sandarakinus]